MIKRIFWNGLQAFVPIALTLAIVIWIFHNIETFFGRFLKYFIPPEHYFDGLGILVGIGLVFCLGALINAWVVNGIYSLAEGILKKIPLIKTLYNALVELMQFFDKSQKNLNQQAVVVHTPMGQMVGFITNENTDNIPDEFAKAHQVLVYIPFSYQIGGFMLSIERSKLQPLGVPVNRAMSWVLTAGMTHLKNEKDHA